MDWYNNRLPLPFYKHDPWDFGLMADAMPFLNVAKLYDGLWDRLYKRQNAMIQIRELMTTWE